MAALLVLKGLTVSVSGYNSARVPVRIWSSIVFTRPWASNPTAFLVGLCRSSVKCRLPLKAAWG